MARPRSHGSLSFQNEFELENHVDREILDFAEMRHNLRVGVMLSGESKKCH